MRTCITRCKHCGREYSYQASGDGCFNKWNNRDYCPECIDAIIQALSKIPVRYKKRLHETERPDDATITIFKSLVEKEEKYDKDYEKQYGFIPPRALKCGGGYPDWVKRAAEFSIDWTLYEVNSPSDDLFDPEAKWYRQEEYDIIDKKFTGNIWHSDNERQYSQLSISHFIKSDFVVERNLSEPSPTLFYMDMLTNLKK